MANKVTLDQSDGLAVITIDDPSTKNAIDVQFAYELIDTCNVVNRDLSIGAAVLRGANDTFCSGANTSAWEGDFDPASTDGYALMDVVYRSFFVFGNLAVPTIAAVRGSAVGAGLNLALSADLRIMSKTARLIPGFMRLGLHPGGGFYTIARRSMNRDQVAALGLFGESTTGTEAHRIGMAYEAVDDDQVDIRAAELAKKAAADPELSRLSVRSFRLETSTPGMNWETALEFERASQMRSQRRRVELNGN
ncbi:MAG: enoyl-CoA hydratase-related protein [Actinomycetota bacterium]|nr:enoyl-CoA hydratase-related protein [Actinomycetota bacterium]